MVLEYVTLYHIHHIWHYGVRLRESGQPIGRLRKTPTRGLLETDLVILNHGQVTRTKLELDYINYHNTPTRLDRFSVHLSPSRRVFRAHTRDTFGDQQIAS
ncbi:hypothetical protein TNCV_42501 [Trichonephila clavipes]|nr:hypothetical protein TNCV_42501 [Trichonephila clavipes]